MWGAGEGVVPKCFFIYNCGTRDFGVCGRGGGLNYCESIRNMNYGFGVWGGGGLVELLQPLFCEFGIWL